MASGPTIVAKFLADTKQLTSDVDKMSSSATSKLEGFGKKAAVAIGGAFAVSAVVDFGKAAVEAAAADAEAQAKLAQTLKNVTGATDAQVAASEDYISGLSKATAIADDDLRPALDTLVRGFGNAEDAQKALALATDVSAGTGKDLATVTSAMQKAAMGQTGALKKLGIETTNADGSAKSLDQMMADMAQTFKGQAATAAESTAGKMRGAEIAMGEMQETIGSALLPVLGTLAGFMSDTLFPAISSVFGWIMDNKDAVVAALIAVAIVITATLGPAFVAWAVAAGAAAVATIAAAAPFIAIGAVIAGVALVIIRNWDTIRNATKAAFDAVKNAIKTAFDWVKQNWPLLLAIITGPIGLAVLAISKNWDTIKEGATAVWNWIKDKFNAVGDFLHGFVDRIGKIASSIADAIKAPINAILSAFNGLSFTIPKISTPKISTPFGDIGGELYGGHTFDFPNIPLLAGGGVLTSPTLFVGGEAGTEIVAPEAMLRAIVAEESGGHYTLNIYPRTADASDVAYGFRRLELMAGIT